MKYLCNCKNESFITYKNFKKGRRCKNCAIIKRKSTNIEKYGCENPFGNKILNEN